MTPCAVCGKPTDSDYPYCSKECEELDEQRAHDFYEATKDEP